MFLFLVLLFVSPIRSVDNPCGTPVQSCPTTEQSWIRRASSFPCSKQHLHYVCIFYKDRQLIEACIINFPVASSAGGCPTVSSCDERGPVLSFYSDYIPCPKDSFACPRKGHGGYQITQLYKFPFCVGENGSEIVSSTTPSMFTSTSSMSVAAIVGIVTSLVAFLVVPVTCISIVYYKRRNRKKTRKGTADSRDSMTQLIHLQNRFQEMTRIFNCEHFYETRAYKKLHSLIEAGQSAILAGHPGTGKSATCVKLYESFYMRKGFNCFILDHDIDLYNFDHQNYDLIFLDDDFQSGFYRKGFDDHCRKLVSKINTLFSKSETLRMVITIDSAMLSLHEEIFKKLTFFSNMINLTASEDAMQSDEKRGILEKHLQRRSITLVNLPENEIWTTSSKGAVQLAISKKTINEIVKDSDSTTNYRCGFPLACYLFCRSRTLFKWRSKFFDEPLLKVKHHIEKLRQSDDPAYTLQYLVYIYTVLRDEIKPHHLDFKLLESVIKDVVPLFSQSTGHVGDMAEIQTEKWKDTCNTSDYLVEYDNGRYKFIHECILLVVLCDFGTWRNDLLQKLCDNKDTLLMFERAKYFAANAENNIMGKTSKDASSLAKHLSSATDREQPLPLKRRGKDRYLFEEEEFIDPFID